MPAHPADAIIARAIPAYQDLVVQHGLSEADIHAIMLGALSEVYVVNVERLMGRGEAGFKRTDEAFNSGTALLLSHGFRPDDLVVMHTLGMLILLATGTPAPIEDRLDFAKRHDKK